MLEWLNQDTAWRWTAYLAMFWALLVLVAFVVAVTIRPRR